MHLKNDLKSINLICICLWNGFHLKRKKKKKESLSLDLTGHIFANSNSIWWSWNMNSVQFNMDRMNSLFAWIETDWCFFRVNILHKAIIFKIRWRNDLKYAFQNHIIQYQSNFNVKDNMFDAFTLASMSPLAPFLRTRNWLGVFGWMTPCGNWAISTLCASAAGGVNFTMYGESGMWRSLN